MYLECSYFLEKRPLNKTQQSLRYISNCLLNIDFTPKILAYPVDYSQMTFVTTNQHKSRQKKQMSVWLNVGCIIYSAISGNTIWNRKSMNWSTIVNK